MDHGLIHQCSDFAFYGIVDWSYIGIFFKCGDGEYAFFRFCSRRGKCTTQYRYRCLSDFYRVKCAGGSSLV